MKKVYVLFLILLFLIALAANMFAQSSAGSLPIVLVNVNAMLTVNKQVAISWTVQQQISTDCFNVQKSNDGVAWQCIAVVKASGDLAGPVTYTSTDMFPLKGSNFYRILMKNINGEFGYTVIKNVRMNEMGKTVIYPNPASNTVNISLQEVAGTDWNLSLINNCGQVLLQKKYSKHTTTVNLPVDRYPTGSYTMQIAAGNNTQNKNLMINHN